MTCGLLLKDLLAGKFEAGIGRGDAVLFHFAQIAAGIDGHFAQARIDSMSGS